MMVRLGSVGFGQVGLGSEGLELRRSGGGGDPLGGFYPSIRQELGETERF